MLDHGSVGHQLLLPRFLGHVQEPTWLSAEQELKGGETGGGLGHLPDAEDNVRQHQVPIPFILCDPLQHLLQGLIEVFHQAVCLWMVDCGP
ncbi:hypothetical protein QQF64_020357 [Cirrhinus molitorella]|uniref:Uncharacterized protein n=1 Tax=Cirrhinus molitorella TaxID=172907 RepID=A0ABR3L938_9TELE